MSREERVRRAIDNRRARINDAIPEELPIRRPERLYAATRHLLDAGGKRLRPIVSLLVAEALTETQFPANYREFPDLHGDTIDLMSAAVSIEIVHLFTLIHDDIMDRDDLRRGVPAVHREFDLETAILAGDTLYSTAFELLLESQAPPDRSVRALDRLARTCTEICEGQAFDIEFESHTDVDIEAYHEMIELKTAVLYGAAAAIPAILVGADRGTITALSDFGIETGCAFQIQDDVLDLVASSESLGKQRGSDLLEGKLTMVTAHARENGVDVNTLLPEGEVSNADIDRAVKSLEDAGSIEFARERARELVESGKQHLAVLPDNEGRQRLDDIADYLIERAY